MADQRVKFPKGEQSKFLIAALSRCGGVNALARSLHISPRTIRDWRREKFLISHQAVRYIRQKYHVGIPKKIILKQPFWYVMKGARQGGLISYQKQGGTIGDPKIREQNWRAWWNKKGKFNSNFPFHPLPFRKARPSMALAEFMGTTMGDGGMTSRQITITLHHVDDLAYSAFVIKLIQKLFHITPSIHHIEKDSVNRIVISRSGLVQYLHKLGLPIGNKVKQNFDIPDWIKKNEKYMIACIRGLVDTDGSVFTHRYRVNGKLYAYKKLSFCSASTPLRSTVQTFLQDHGFHIRASRGIDLRIESKFGIERYMQLIGSHNLKHLNRYHN